VSDINVHLIGGIVCAVCVFYTVLVSCDSVLSNFFYLILIDELILFLVCFVNEGEKKDWSGLLKKLYDVIPEC